MSVATKVDPQVNWSVKRHKLHLVQRDGSLKKVGFDCVHRRAGMGACAGCYARMLVLAHIANDFLHGKAERMRFKACLDEALAARDQEDAVRRLTGKTPK